ncbi:MAG: hypothetical protein ACYCT7_01740 [bacterium]
MNKVENMDFLKETFDELEYWFNDLTESFYKCKNIEDSNVENKQFEILESLYKMQIDAGAVKDIINNNINAVILKILKLKSGNTVPTKKSINNFRGV